MTEANNIQEQFMSTTTKLIETFTGAICETTPGFYYSETIDDPWGHKQQNTAALSCARQILFGITFGILRSTMGDWWVLGYSDSQIG